MNFNWRLMFASMYRSPWRWYRPLLYILSCGARGPWMLNLASFQRRKNIIFQILANQNVVMQPYFAIGMKIKFSIKIKSPVLLFVYHCHVSLQSRRKMIFIIIIRVFCRPTRNWRGAVASRCFPHSTLSLASEQTLKGLKRSQGHRLWGKGSGFG